MTKKHLFKRATALLLSALLATSPALVYAEDAMFVDEVGAEEVAQDEVGFSDEITFDDGVVEDASESASFDVVGEETFEEEATGEDEGFATDFFDDVEVSYGNPVVVEDIIDDTLASDDAAYADTVSVKFNAGGGSGTAMTDQTATKGVGLILTRHSYTNGNKGFVNWTSSGNTITPTNPADGVAITVPTTAGDTDVTLTANWSNTAEASIYKTASGSAMSPELKYSTLAVAVAAANGLEGVQLEDDCSTSATINKTLILNLNSKTYSGTITVSSGSTLTVIDESASGAGVVTGSISVGSGATLLLRAGTYSRDVTQYCDDGYCVTKPTSTTYKVIAKSSAKAKIGDVYFTSVADALEAATSGQTVSVIAADTISKRVIVPYGVTITAENDTVITVDTTGHVLFSGQTTINPKVTFSGISTAFTATSSINVPFTATGSSGDVNAIGGSSTTALSIDGTKTFAATALRILFGASVNVTGNLASGGAIASSAPTTTANLGAVTFGTRNNNTINLKNVAAEAALSGSNEQEVSGTIATTLNTEFGYVPGSVGSSGTMGINLDNTYLNASGIALGTIGKKAITLSNGSKLVASTADLILANGDTLKMDWKSQITAKSWTNNGTFTVDLSGMTKDDLVSGKKVLVTLTDQASKIGTVTLENNSGYGVALDSDNKSIILVKGIAQVEGSSAVYSTVSEAVAAATAGGTVKLLDDVTDTVAISKNLTLDLGDGILTGNVTVSDGYTLTVKAATDGTINGTVINNGTLTLQSGKIATLSSTTKNTSSTTVSDGTITTATLKTGALTVSGGTIGTLTLGETGQTTENLPTASITGGKVTTGITVVENFGSLSVTTTLTDIISKVKPPTTNTYVWTTSGTTSKLEKLADAVKKDGTIKLSGNVALAVAEKIDVSGKVTLDLNGYNFTEVASPTAAYLIGVKRGGELTIINTGNTKSAITSARTTTILMNPDDTKSSTANAVLVVGSTASGQNYFEIKNTATGSADAPSSAIGGAAEYQKTSVTVNGGEITATGTYGIGINNPQKNSTLTISGGEISGTTKGISIGAGTTFTMSNGDVSSLGITTGTEAISATISGGVIAGTISEGPKAKNVTLKISGGKFGVAEGGITVASANNFIEGGEFKFDISDGTNYVATGYIVNKQAGEYGYIVQKDIPTYVLTVTSNLTSATLSPASGTKYAAGASVSLTASAAPSGYTFGGWYAGTTLIGTAGSLTATYTMPSAATTVTARYLKNLTVKAIDDTVATGSAYTGDKTKITVTGADSGDTNIINTTSMTMTASTYNKDTSKVGSTHDIVLAGATINSSFATKYTITTYTKGTLTVIEGTGPETFIADVAKLPAATAVTVDNLAATKAGVETAKSDYSKLSTSAKDLADVKTAKAKLDAVEAAVTKLEADKAAADVVTTAIASLPAAADAKASDKKAADDAKNLYDALTADQKKLISDADVAKLNAVKAAADKAEETDAAAAKKVKDDAAQLPSISQVEVSDKAAVQAVRDEYEALTPEQQARIPEVDTQLKALEDVIKAKEEEEKGEDQKKADEVAAMIEAIKDAPAGKQKAATEEAREAFDELTDAQKALLPKSAETLLEDAEAAFEEGRIFGLNGQRYKVLSNGDVTYHRPQDKDTVESVNVPNQVKKGGYLFKVVKISINAFNTCPNLQWVVVGKNVVSLGKCSFKGTPKLKKIKFMGTGVKTATSAFTGAGKNKGTDLTVFTKASVVDKYENLFKGAGKLNEDAIVTEME